MQQLRDTKTVLEFVLLVGIIAALADHYMRGRNSLLDTFARHAGVR